MRGQLSISGCSICKRRLLSIEVGRYNDTKNRRLLCLRGCQHIPCLANIEQLKERPFLNIKSGWEAK